MHASKGRYLLLYSPDQDAYHIERQSDYDPATANGYTIIARGTYDECCTEYRRWVNLRHVLGETGISEREV